MSQIGDVRLAAPNETDLPREKIPFELVSYNRKTLSKWVDESRIILVQGFLMAEYPTLQDFGGFLVVDLYDVYPLEELSIRPPSKLGLELYRHTLFSLLIQLVRGDFFICASERQRDFWLGMLSAMGRINPLTHENDPSLCDLIDVVFYGIPADSPVKTKNVIKGVIPNINKEDKVLIWGGGIYDWLDPITPIRAIETISKTRKDVKLFFMASTHPDQDRVSSKVMSKAMETSRELQLLNNQVFFNPGWVPYRDRQDYLLEADIGISSHPNHLETRFSNRTRLLDYIWAGLPIVVTGEDSLSDLIREYKLGKVVLPGDSEAFAKAILSILSTENYKEIYSQRSPEVSMRLSWGKAVEPLLKYCFSPRRASDAEVPERQRLFQSLLKRGAGANTAFRKGYFSLQEEGLDTFFHRAKAYFKRRANK